MFYTAADKLVYESPTGVKYDPLAVHRKLIFASGGSVNDSLSTWADSTASDVERAAAEEQLVRYGRTAFDLKPFDQDGGVVDGVVLDCLDHYLRWVDAKK